MCIHYKERFSDYFCPFFSSVEMPRILYVFTLFQKNEDLNISLINSFSRGLTLIIRRTEIQYLLSSFI